MTKKRAINKSILSKIRSWIKGEGIRIKHFTNKPVTVRRVYYKKSRKGSYRFYVWVIVCDEGIIHTKMPFNFKPPNTARVVDKYDKGHRPRLL